MENTYATYRDSFAILDRYGYDVYKLELSVIKKLNTYDAYFGAYKDFRGKNSGAGKGLFASIIYKF